MARQRLVPRECPHCRDTFHPPHHRSRYCSPPCAYRSRPRRSTRRSQIVAAYTAGDAVKNIMADFGMRNWRTFYNVLKSYDVPLRRIRRA